MKIVLDLGQSIDVEFEGTDGVITVKFGPAALTVNADLPDATGRVGIIYSEAFGIYKPGKPIPFEQVEMEGDENDQYQNLAGILSAAQGGEVDRSIDDFGIDRLDLAELLEQDFGLNRRRVNAAKTVNDLIALVKNRNQHDDDLEDEDEEAGDVETRVIQAIVSVTSAVNLTLDDELDDCFDSLDREDLAIKLDMEFGTDTQGKLNDIETVRGVVDLVKKLTA